MEQIIDQVKTNVDYENIFDQYETENIEKYDTPMKRFYKGKTIFLTGGTGFVGILLLEKLLRCDVKKVFLFVRPKKGKQPAERVNEIFEEPVYVRLRNNREYYESKITIVEGNLSDDGLGIATEMRKLITSETEIFIHTAANVRFDEHLKDAIFTNVKGTYEMLRLAEETKTLLCFMHMSTAYANCPQKEIKEQFYETPMDPFCMMKLAELMSDEEKYDIRVLTDKIVYPWPNTYAYTKALAEELMRIYCEKLPIVVVRPSIIMMTYEDPIPGWLNNLYGINGVFTGVGMGVLRIFHIDNRKKADIVPADIVVNASLAVIWNTVEKGGIKTQAIIEPSTKLAPQPVFNCINCVDNPLTWGDVKTHSVPMASKYASSNVLWIGLYNTTRYSWIYYVLRIFYHVFPAFIFDAAMRLQGKKPQVVMLYKKIHRFAGAIAYFTNNEWNFRNGNMRMVLNSMDPVDKKYFFADIGKLRWADIFEVFGLGIRLYIGRETLDTLPQGQAHYKKLKILHNIILCIVYSFLAFSIHRILRFYGFIDYSKELTHNVTSYLKEMELPF